MWSGSELMKDISPASLATLCAVAFQGDDDCGFLYRIYQPAWQVTYCIVNSGTDVLWLAEDLQIIDKNVTGHAAM